MSVSCTRRLQWAMGHRVYGHENKCGHLHGHNYVGFFTAEADSLDPQGRVIDFSALKEIIGTWIDENWDHGFVLWSADTAIGLVAGCPDVPGGEQKLYIMDTNPTAENLASHLGEVILPELFEGTGIRITEITLYETENGLAKWSANQH